MVVVNSLRDTVVLLKRHRSLVGYLAIAGVVTNFLGSSQYLLYLEGVKSLLALVSLVVGPAILVGIEGMVNEAVTGGRVSVDVFVASARRNYLPFVGATLVAGVGVAVAFVAFSVASTIPVVSLFATVLFFPFVVTAGITLQFVDVAIVVDDAGPLESIKRSYAVSVANLESVVPYVALETGLAVLFAGPLFHLLDKYQLLLSIPLVDGRLSRLFVLFRVHPSIAGALLLAVVGSILLYTYRVTFYRSLS